MKINKDKIRELIGPGGKMIKSICEASKAKVDIDDNGTVTITSLGLENGIKAQKLIEEIAMEPEINKIYHGKVVKIMEFGAFINIMSGKDGFLHISEISNEKISDINDVLKEDSHIWVKVIGFDQRGKVKLAMKVVDQVSGESLSADLEVSSSETKPSSNKERSVRPQNKKSSSSASSSVIPAYEKASEPQKTEKRKYFG
jgi:polyribonucleotide nucleotidyltransferase